MKKTNAVKLLNRLEQESSEWNAPVIALMAQHKAEPFRILIATVLSARTKDEVTASAVHRLFARVNDPASLAAMSAAAIARIIYPVGFYRNKAIQIKSIAQELIERFHSKVPDTLESLLEFPGVGRKTANLVLARAFRIPAICVDTHVHRISNRLGWVCTSTPEKTETALALIIPKRHWMRINTLLVAFGQTLCKPIGPKCPICPIQEYCPHYQSLKSGRKGNPKKAVKKRRPV